MMTYYMHTDSFHHFTSLDSAYHASLLYYKCKVPHSPLHSLWSGGVDGTDHQQKMALLKK